MRYLLIPLILLLFNAPNAFAQEWYEAAEASSAGYELPTSTDGCKSAKLNKKIAKKVEELPDLSSFEYYNNSLFFHARGALRSAPAGPRGIPLEPAARGTSTLSNTSTITSAVIGNSVKIE